MRKWENEKKSHFFFASFFQYSPNFDVMPDIGKIATLPNKNGPRVDIMREVRHNYNHKPPKKSRKKNYKQPRWTCAQSRTAAPLFAVRKGDTNPTEIDRRNTPENPPQNNPEIDPPKPSRNHPQKHPAQTPPDIRQTIASRHPKI